MEAKDTIISDEQIRLAKAEAERLSWTHKVHPSYEREKFLLETQALISFKAGIREVVGWITVNCPPDKISLDDEYDTGHQLGEDWQAKLKDWRI